MASSSADAAPAVEAPSVSPSVPSVEVPSVSPSVPHTVDDFKLISVIGKGSYGKVMVVESLKEKGNFYAMKMLRKENVVKRNQVAHTATERNVLGSVNHPFIVNLYYAFQTPKKLYFVMEYCNGGELFYHLSRSKVFNEARAKFYASEILLALGHLHSLHIIYRDLKPENLILTIDGHVKVTDFGLSKEGIDDNSSAKSMCGTPEYLAPEILAKKGHGKAVDWYSLGALVFEMLTGLPPFYTRDRQKLFKSIESAELKYPSTLSKAARLLLAQVPQEGEFCLLDRNPDRRLGGEGDVEQVKAHPFFASVDFNAILNKEIQVPYKPNVQTGAEIKYVDKEFTDLPAVNSEHPGEHGGEDVKHFEGFTFMG